MSLSFINANILLILALLLPGAVIFWFYDVKKMRRPVAIVFAVAAAALVIGVQAWQDSLASLISTERSLAVLVIIFGLSVAMFLVHLGSVRVPRRHRDGGAPVRQGKDRYHHVWTHVAAAVAGTTGALLFADGINFLRAVGKAPAGAGTALTTTMHRVASGKAAAAVHAGHTSPTVVVGVGIGILLLLVVAARRHPAVPHRAPKSPRGAIGSGRQSPTALNPGSPSAGLSRRS